MKLGLIVNCLANTCDYSLFQALSQWGKLVSSFEILTLIFSLFPYLQIKIKADGPGHGIILHLQLLNNRLKQFCKKFARMNYAIFWWIWIAFLFFLRVWQSVSDVRRELMFWKKIKIPWFFECWRTLVEFVCHHWSVRVTLLNRSVLFGGNTHRGGGTPIHGSLGYIIWFFVLWEMAWFWGRVSVFPFWRYI